jgi:hypothetical protein
MNSIDATLDDNVAAAAEFLETASRCDGVWNVPRTGGGWSPAQVTEHVSLTLEEGAAVVSGRPSKFPTFPALLRPLARIFYYNRALKNGAFPQSKTTTALEPSKAAATLAEADARLQAAVRTFNQACRDRVANGRPLEHPVFGTVSVESYARFQALHTRHHIAQLPG